MKERDCGGLLTFLANLELRKFLVPGCRHNNLETKLLALVLAPSGIRFCVPGVENFPLSPSNSRCFDPTIDLSTSLLRLLLLKARTLQKLYRFQVIAVYPTLATGQTARQPPNQHSSSMGKPLFLRSFMAERDDQRQVRAYFPR